MEALRDNDPTSIGGYRLLGRLGAGSMGVVYLGQDERGHPIAVKAIASAITTDPDHRARFRREVELALRVSSPYTARVVAADTRATRPYMVTEYVAGETLKDRVDRAGPLDQDQVLALAAGLAAGLAAIHDAGVTHRDLSAGNVILASDGPRIVDLGVAHFEGAAHLTKAGTSWGTPAFMSPEHASGLKVAPPSDVFSWGSLVTFAATGHPPFGLGRPEQLLYRIVHEPPRIEGVPVSLTASVQLALHKQATERPTATELASRITGGLEGDDTTPVAALISQTWHVDAATTRQVAPATTRVASPPSRTRWVGSAALLTVLVAAAGLVWTNWPYDEQFAGADGAASASSEAAVLETVASPSPPASDQPSPPSPVASATAAPSRQPPTPMTTQATTPSAPESSTPSAAPEATSPAPPTETAPGRPEPPTAPWDSDPVEANGHLQDVATAFYSDMAEWDGCTLYAPTEIESGLQAVPSDWSPLWTRFGFFNFEWSYPDDASPASTVAIHPPESQAVTQFFDDDPDGTTFADGSVLRLGGDSGLTHLLTVPGEPCYYTFQWYSMVGLSYVETVRPIQEPSAEDVQAAEEGPPPPARTGVPRSVPQWAMDEVRESTGEDWWVIQDHWEAGRTLNAVVAAPAGSATGRGRHVFFFVDDRGYIGRDLSEPSEASQIAWSTGDTIAVEYTLYRDDDAGCCPTGGSSTVRFQWTGEELVPLDPIPPLDGPVHR